MGDYFDNDYWQRYGVFEDDDMEDVRSARKIGRYDESKALVNRGSKNPSYKGDAVVLPYDDPLSVEWDLWEELYG